MKTITEKEAIENTTLSNIVEKDSELKNMIVDYVGINSKEYIPYGVDDNEVTVQMIVDIFANEFPEFIMAIAEENWVRGYTQALDDVDEGKQLLTQKTKQISDEQWVAEYNQHQETLENE